MKVRNKHIYSTDQEYLIKLREEYIQYGGAVTSIEPGCLTIHARRHTTKNRDKHGGSKERPKRPSSSA